MPGIRRRTDKSGGIGVIYFGSEKEIAYCQRCLEIANVRTVLGNRIYFPDKSGDIVIPPDADNWRQCYECGSIYPRYNVKQESELVDVVEILHNPHDFGKGVIVGWRSTQV